jgi:hypothetical protein
MRSTADNLRQQALRLRARATTAHDKGNADLADSLTGLAMRYSDRADQLEADKRKTPQCPSAKRPRP